MRLLHLRCLAVALIAAVTLAFAGCGESTRPSVDTPSPVDPTRAFVERLLPNLDDDLRRHTEAAATGQALADYLERESKRGWNARVDGGIKYADLFERLYRERGYHKIFAQSDGLTRRGQTALDVLRQSDRHALDPAPYHVARIQTLTGELKRVTAGQPKWQGVALRADEAEAIVAWLGEEGLDPHDPATRLRLLDALVGVDTSAGLDPQAAAPDSPLPRVTQALASFQSAFEKTAGLAAELELRVADGSLRYARDMKHFNLNRQDWRDLRDVGGSKALIYGRLEKTYGHLAEASGEDAVRAVFADLEPKHRQYDRLVEALARYRAMLADGEWGRVRPFEVELGKRSPRVVALRERLAREGFLPPLPRQGDPGAQPAADHAGGAGAPAAPAAGAATTAGGEAAPADAAGVADEAGGEPAFDPAVVDAELVEAIHSYQESHQFRVETNPTPGFWRSLNLPITRRIAQIELAIQRWRESRYMGEPDFVMINIPDFHAEVWRDGERVMRFRVVVGNRKRVCDRETGKWKLPNATPIQMAELDHVIVNPYWYVPNRIIREEIEPEMRQNPDYLAEKNYEVVTMGGKETIRQKPGADNALGLVKFIFPNPHNTYMHDTPMKKYFDYPVRAFSHGCIRVHEPLDLARHLLGADPNGQTYSLDELVEKGDQKYIELEEKIPVFAEYYTVRVDDQGRTHFLADIYDHDERRMSDDPEAFDNCRVRRARPEQEELEEEVPEGVDSDLGP